MKKTTKDTFTHVSLTKENSRRTKIRNPCSYLFTLRGEWLIDLRVDRWIDWRGRLWWWRFTRIQRLRFLILRLFLWFGFFFRFCPLIFLSKINKISGMERNKTERIRLHIGLRVVLTWLDSSFSFCSRSCLIFLGSHSSWKFATYVSLSVLI